MTSMNPHPIALVVNDDRFQLHLAASILTRDGFEVIPCPGAEEALESLIQRGAVDVIITDLYMPGIDGWRFCRLLRSSAYRAFNATPILVVSATFAGAEAEELTAQLGADGFLPAPYEPSVLCRAVRDLLGDGRPKSQTTVLIVDSDRPEAQILTETFQAGGYAVKCAGNGEAALRQFRAHRPQVVIVDDDLPDMDSGQLLNAIKTPAATTVVIVITRDASADNALQLLRLGADNYTPKPVAPEYLLHLCQTAARQRALLRVEELLELRTRKLRHSEERYRRLFESAGVGLVTYSLDGTVIAVNQSFEVLSGRSRDDLVGKHYSQYLTPAAYARAAAQQGRARAEKRPFWCYEAEISRPDRRSVPSEARLSYLPGGDGRPGWIMGMYRDLSVEKQLQQQRAEFSAMLAHDIRNPVGLILGCISLVLNETPPPDAQLVKKCHLRILDDARLLQSLVNNYLDISTIEAGQLKPNRRLVDLSDLLKNIVQRYGWESEAHAIHLEAIAGKCPMIQGDALLLERVFGNLMQNALKFTPVGGEISLRVEPREREVAISVHNSGPEIDAKKLPSLFEKFKHFDEGSYREGLGLGLYIVKELVEAHHGRVEVESRPNVGNCFKVILPLWQEDAGMAPADMDLVMGER
jgi:PAS domain S-box-containing protein